MSNKPNITHLKSMVGNHWWKVGNELVILWNSGARSLISIEGFCQRYDFNRLLFKDNDLPAQMKWLEDNIQFVRQYIRLARVRQVVVDTLRTVPVWQTVVSDREGVFVATLSVASGYVTVTGDMMCPEAESDVISDSWDLYWGHYQEQSSPPISEDEARKEFNQQLEDFGPEGFIDSSFKKPIVWDGQKFYMRTISGGTMFKEIKRLTPELEFAINLHFKTSHEAIMQVVEFMNLNRRPPVEQQIIEAGVKYLNSWLNTKV